MAPEQPEQPAQDGQRQQTRRQRVGAALLGLASGLGVNALSTDVGYRGAAGAAALVAVFYATGWLRRLHPQASLVRIATWTLLAAAAVAAVVAIAVPNRDWAGYATITAALLATAAALIPSSSEDALSLLAGVAV